MGELISHILQGKVRVKPYDWYDIVLFLQLRVLLAIRIDKDTALFALCYDELAVLLQTAKFYLSDRWVVVFFSVAVLVDFVAEFVYRSLLSSVLWAIKGSRCQANHHDFVTLCLQVEFLQVAEHAFIRFVNNHDRLLLVVLAAEVELILDSLGVAPARSITVDLQVLIVFFISGLQRLVLEDHIDIIVGCFKEQEGESCMNPRLALSGWNYPYLAVLPLVIQEG